MTRPYDPLEQLTIAELDAVSRKLGTDVATAVHNGGPQKWGGLALVAWTMAARTDPSAKLADYRAMTPAQLTAALGYPDDPEPAAPADLNAEFSVSANESAPADLDDLDDAGASAANAAAEAAAEAAPAAQLDGQLDGLDAIAEAATADPMGPTRA